jgi:hypothetical protein
MTADVMRMYIDGSFIKHISNGGAVIIASQRRFTEAHGGSPTNRLHGPNGPRFFLARTRQAPHTEPVAAAIASGGYSGEILQGSMTPLEIPRYGRVADQMSSMFDLGLLPPQASCALIESMLVEALAWSDEVKEAIQRFIAQDPEDVRSREYETMLSLAHNQRSLYIQCTPAPTSMFA